MIEGTRSVESYEKASHKYQYLAIASGVLAVTCVALAALAFFKGDLRAVLQGQVKRPSPLLNLGVGISVLSLTSMVAALLLIRNAKKEQEGAEKRKAEIREAQERVARENELRARQAEREQQERVERENKLQKIRAIREQQKTLKAELAAISRVNKKDIGSKLYECFKEQDLNGKLYLIRNMTENHVEMIKTCKVEAIKNVANTIAEQNQMLPAFKKLWNGHWTEFAQWVLNSEVGAAVADHFYCGLDEKSKNAAKKMISRKAENDVMFAANIAQNRNQCLLFQEVDLGLV